MSHLRVHGLKTKLNNMIEIHWVLLMERNMAYLRAQHGSLKVRRLYLKKAWYLALVKCLDIYLELQKMSKLGLKMELNWAT